ncbi:MAG: periplasmic heavy metal sensor [Alphaproteobacteria bacterium]
MLLLSIGLNCLLLAVFIGHVARFGLNPLMMPAFIIERQHQELLRFLPPEKAEMFHQTMLRTIAKHQASKAEMDEMREKLFAIITATDFDEESFRKQFKQMNTMRDDLQNEIMENLVVFIRGLNGEERKKLAEHLKKLDPMMPPPMMPPQ